MPLLFRENERGFKEMTEKQEDLGIVVMMKEEAVWTKEKERIASHIKILEESIMIEQGFLEFIEQKLKEIHKD